MQSLLRNRALVFGGLGLLLLLVLLTVRRAVVAQPVAFVDFEMPYVSGWERKVRESRRSPVVMYERKTADSRLYIGLTHKPGETTDTPKTAADLQNDLVKGGQGMQDLLQKWGVSMQIRSGPIRPISFHGLTAVEMQSTMTTKKNVTFGRTIRFVKGLNNYILQVNVGTNSRGAVVAPPELQAEMDRAMTIIEGAIQP